MKNEAYELRLERRFFAVNAAGDNEFDWLLQELGVPEKQRGDIDEVTVCVDLNTVACG